MAKLRVSKEELEKLLSEKLPLKSGGIKWLGDGSAEIDVELDSLPINVYPNWINGNTIWDTTTNPSFEEVSVTGSNN